MNLKRSELLELREKFSCSTWKDTINLLLKENFDKEEIDILFKIPLLLEQGSEEQIEAVEAYGIILDTYQFKQSKWVKENNIKVGDTVKIKRALTKEEKKKWTSTTLQKNIEHKVVSIEKDGIYVDFSSSVFKVLVPYTVLEKVEVKYVPFTFEDDLLGMKVIHKSSNFKIMISHQDKEHVYIQNNGYTSYEELLADYTFLDGTPCGKRV